MAATTAMHSTALAGQSLVRPVIEFARQLGSRKARVSIRETASKSAGNASIWYVDMILSFRLVGFDALI